MYFSQKGAYSDTQGLNINRWVIKYNILIVKHLKT